MRNKSLCEKPCKIFQTHQNTDKWAQLLMREQRKGIRERSVSLDRLTELILFLFAFSLTYLKIEKLCMYYTRMA
jgi:hypothetical protein